MNRMYRLMLSYIAFGILLTPVALFLDNNLADNFFANFMCVVFFATGTFLNFMFAIIIPGFLIKVETLASIFMVFFLFMLSQQKDWMPTFFSALWGVVLYLLILNLQILRGGNLAIKKDIEKLEIYNLLEFCKHCGSPMCPEDVFCFNCWTITPKVKKMLSNSPGKYPYQYRTYQRKRKFLCPHCNSFYAHHQVKDGTGKLIGFPIVFCKNCKNYFIDDELLEYSVAHAKYKNNRFLFFFLLVLTPIYIFLGFSQFFSVPLSLVLTAVYIAVYILCYIVWNKIVTKELIEESRLRLERNPDYPQILIDMGYGNLMDEKYQVSYRKQEMTWKDVIKEAFTFD